jgi:hypothetical protein
MTAGNREPRSADYRIAMKSLFMRAQQALHRADRGERRPGRKCQKMPANPATFRVLAT